MSLRVSLEDLCRYEVYRDSKLPPTSAYVGDVSDLLSFFKAVCFDNNAVATHKIGRWEADRDRRSLTISSTTTHSTSGTRQHNARTDWLLQTTRHIRNATQRSLPFPVSLGRSSNKQTNKQESFGRTSIHDDEQHHCRVGPTVVLCGISR